MSDAENERRYYARIAELDAIAADAGASDVVRWEASDLARLLRKYAGMTVADALRGSRSDGKDRQQDAERHDRG